MYFHFTLWLCWQHFLDTTACKDHAAVQCAWILIGDVHRDHTLGPCHRWDRQRLGRVDCGHSVEDSVVLPIFHQLFCCIPIFCRGDQFPLRWSGWFLQCENRICMIHLYRFTFNRSTRWSAITSEMDLRHNVCRKLYLLVWLPKL